MYIVSFTYISSFIEAEVFNDNDIIYDARSSIQPYLMKYNIANT